ncbi:MAG: thioesterase [Muribaculaceae bacterium]|nr:thioesterase [Muribaculaceae bacterium]
MTDNKTLSPTLRKRYFLTPAECNPQGRMPITLLINRLIEVATLHANELGIGWAYLKDFHQTWVLSRVAVEMAVYPGVNDFYEIETWVCSINRLFSERDFCIFDGDGKVIGWARTVWAVLDTETRRGADISRMEWISQVAQPDRCPVAKSERPRALSDYTAERYRFTYCDLDFNRHVNSSRYIELLLNQWSLGFHDKYRLTRFEIAYLREAYFDEEVEVRLQREPGNEAAGSDESVTRAELAHDGQVLCRSLLRFSPR